jgi:hypothetical protein
VRIHLADIPGDPVEKNALPSFGAASGLMDIEYFND